jgi:hypothetical protein
MLDGLTVNCPGVVELPDTVKLVEVLAVASARVTVPVEEP